jgi:hypothetical protein
MGFVGFDGTLLGALTNAVSRATDDLAAVRLHDTAEAQASWLLTCAIDSLDRWQDTLRGIINEVCTLDYTPVRLLPVDFANAMLYDEQRTAGWTVLADPTDAPYSDDELAMNAAAIGSRLTDPAVLFSLDTEATASLQIELDRLKRSPAASRAFVAALGDNGMIGLTDHLARQRRPPRDGSSDAVSLTAEQMLRSIGAILDNIRPAADGDVPAIVLRLDPVAAACVVSQLGIDKDALAAITLTILDRWQFGSPADDGRTSLDVLWSQSANDVGGGPGDILIAHLITVPGASTAYVQLAIKRPPSVLFGTVADSTLFHRMMIDAVAPANASSQVARQITLFVLHTVRHNGDDSLNEMTRNNLADHRYLGEMVAPWLLELVRSKPDWGVDAAVTYAGLDVLVSDATSRTFLLDHVNVWLSKATLGVVGGSELLRALLGALNDIHGVWLELAIHNRVANDSLKTLVADLVVAVGGLFDAPLYVTVGLAGVSSWVQSMMTSTGGEALKRADAARSDAATTALAYVKLSQVYEAALADGSLPANTPKPPPPNPKGVTAGLGESYVDDIDAWKKTLPETVAMHVESLENLLLNPTVLHTLARIEAGYG